MKKDKLKNGKIFNKNFKGGRVLAKEKKELIERRKSYIPYEEAKKVQQRLIDIYASEYKPKHSKATYYKLLIDNEVGKIKESHQQDTNYPDTVFEVFSIVAQHVRGYTKEHCLDQIYDCVKAKKKRIKEYKKLPSLEELVNSKIKTHPKKIYYWRNKTDYEDMCSGESGANILAMRKIGIAQFRLNRDQRF